MTPTRNLGSEGEPYWYLGMMSGTSFDAIDVAMLLTDGIRIFDHGPAHSYPLEPSLREKLSSCLGRTSAPTELVDEVTQAHASAAQEFLRQASDRPVRAVGFHGQTIFHSARDGITVQIGDGRMLASKLNIPVVAQFRLQDMAEGGEGAPIAAIYHDAMLRRGVLPAAQVNIGGVSNVTWTDGQTLIAFDCGPGNARIDDWMARYGLVMDIGGAHGLAGTINEHIVTAALSDPFYKQPPPKSLDRDDLLVRQVGQLSLRDGAATLAAITADAIAAASQWLPVPPGRWVVGGGGRKNQAIMARLRQRLGAEVLLAEDAGQDGDAVESYMIAYLAARHFAGLPITFPSTTGVGRDCAGGTAFLPERNLR